MRITRAMEHIAIFWTIRISAILYATAVTGMLANWPTNCVRALWTAGCVLYLAHVAAAFHYVHSWSHSAAMRETARQTAALFGIDWGGGLYFNYVFTALWTADVIWWWASERTHGLRSSTITSAIHAYMAFMFVNGAIVFPSGPVRWIAIGIAALIGVLWIRNQGTHARYTR